MSNETPQEKTLTFEQMNQIMFGDRFEDTEREVVRDPITGRIKAGPDGSDTQLLVTFTAQPVYSKFESAKAGGPKYVDMDFITILVPGDKLTTVHRPVTDYDQWRFKDEWANYQKGEDQ